MALLLHFWVVLFQCCIIFSYYYRCSAQNYSSIPAILVFGDSGVDTGNNNYLPTTFRANYRPYGMNFPGGIPTGRFSDGKLVPDMFASMLGLAETIPPFLQPNLSDYDLRKGACFASAAAGLDNRTLAYTGQTNMLQQPEYLAAYIERLTKNVGEQEARRIVRDALVIINAGNVDFIYNYYFIHTGRMLKYSVTEYQDLLLNNLQTLIKKLYDLGCRRMSISGLPPIGCLPLIMTTNSPLWRTCLEKVNSDAQIYNEKLVKLLPQVEATLPGSKLFYADLYTPLIEIIKNPKEHGFVESARGCCGTGVIEFGQLCNPITLVCKNPHEYVFWDVVHPTESAYRYINEYLVKQLGSQI